MHGELTAEEELVEGATLSATVVLSVINLRFRSLHPSIQSNEQITLRQDLDQLTIFVGYAKFKFQINSRYLSTLWGFEFFCGVLLCF